MANRLEQIKRIKQGIGFAKEHADKNDWPATILVQGGVIEQMLALIEGEDLNAQSDPDVYITFEKECDEQE